MKKKNKTIYVFLLISLSWSLSVRADVFKAESESYFSKYLDENKQIRMPFFEQMSLYYSKVNQSNVQDYRIHFNYFYDLEKGSYDFQLNQFNFETQFADGLGSLSLGRNYQTKYLIFSSISDQISGSYLFLSKRLELGASLGMARNFELAVEKEQVYLYGFFANYKTEQVFPWQLGLKIEQTDFSRLNRAKSDWLELSARKEFASFVNPEILFSYNTQLADKKSYKKNFGINIYPDYDFSLGGRYSVYRMDKKEFWEESISSIITNGEIKEVGITSNYLISSNFQLGMDYSQSDYPLEVTKQAKGNKLEMSLRWMQELQQIELSAYQISSYGGFVKGEKSRFIRSLYKNIELEAAQEYLLYEKITNAKNSASQAQLGLASWFGRYSRFWIAAELVSNNFYAQDLRLLSRLTIYDWREL